MTEVDLLGEPVKKYSRCRVCGRPLKSLTSQLKGVGPICEKKFGRR